MEVYEKRVSLERVDGQDGHGESLTDVSKDVS